MDFQTSSEQSLPRTNKHIQKSRVGRPKKNKSEQQQQQQHPQQTVEFWFQDKELAQLVSFIGSEGQILFKCLSGKTPSKIKMSENMNDQDFKEYKLTRQNFIDSLNNTQNDILRHLGYESEDNKDISYLLIGQNNEYQIDSKTNSKLSKIYPLIHPNFIQTFKYLIANHEHQVDCLAEQIYNNPMSHKMLLDWALIRELTNTGRVLLSQLQNEIVVDYLDKVNTVHQALQSQYQSMKDKSIQQIYQNYKDQILDRITTFMTQLFEKSAVLTQQQ